MSKKFSIWDEPADNQVWNGKPTKPPICATCINRFPDGTCDIYDIAQQSQIIANDKCDDYIEKKSK